MNLPRAFSYVAVGLALTAAFLINPFTCLAQDLSPAANTSQEDALRAAIRKAEDARNAGDDANALTYYDAVIKGWPGAPVGYAGKGVVLMNRNRHREALPLFEKAKQLAADKHTYQALIAATIFELSEFDRAIAAVNEAITLGSKDPNLLVLRGIAYSRTREPEKALADFAAASAADPKLDRPYLEKGFSLLQLNRFKDAKELLSDTITRNPRDPEAYYYRAIARANLDDLDGAIADLSSLIAIDPASSDAYSARGDVYLKQERFPQAKADLERAYLLEPTDIGALVQLSYISYRVEDPDGLLKWAAKAVETNPKDAMAINNRAYAKILKKDYAGAKADIERALSIDPNHVFAMNNQALLKFYAGDNKGALADIDNVIGLDPTFPEAYLNRGYVRASQRKYREAIEDFSKAIELRPWLRLAFEARAAAYEAIGQKEKAKEDRTTSAKLFEVIKEVRAYIPETAVSK